MHVLKEPNRRKYYEILGSLMGFVVVPTKAFPNANHLASCCPDTRKCATMGGQVLSACGNKGMGKICMVNDGLRLDSMGFQEAHDGSEALVSEPGSSELPFCWSENCQLLFYTLRQIVPGLPKLLIEV